MRTALEKLANELPTILAGLAAVLYIFGLAVPDDLLGELVEHLEALVAFALWLFLRFDVNGPVTRWRLRTAGDGHDAEGDLEPGGTGP